MDRARWSFVLGILGVSCVPLLPSAVALILARPLRHDSDTARIGWILGLLGVILPLAAALLGALLGLILATTGHAVTWEDLNALIGR